MEYKIHTLHRGKFIWILLGGLFAVGYILSFFELRELVKIIALLFCIPAIMFLGAKLSYQDSTWTIDSNRLIIEKAGKTSEVAIDQIEYIKNHMRSGGNLLAIYRKGKSTPMRVWRNKLFVHTDQFDELTARLRELGIEFVIA